MVLITITRMDGLCAFHQETERVGLLNMRIYNRCACFFLWLCYDDEMTRCGLQKAKAIDFAASKNTTTASAVVVWQTIDMQPLAPQITKTQSKTVLTNQHQQQCQLHSLGFGLRFFIKRMELHIYICERHFTVKDKILQHRFYLCGWTLCNLCHYTSCVVHVYS